MFYVQVLCVEKEGTVVPVYQIPTASLTAESARRNANSLYQLTKNGFRNRLVYGVRVVDAGGQIVSERNFVADMLLS